MKKALKLSIALIVLVVALQPCAFAALEYAFQDVPMRIEIDDGWALFVFEEGEMRPVYTSEAIVDAFGFENREEFNQFWVEDYKIAPDGGYEQAIILFISESKVYGAVIHLATRDDGYYYGYIIDSLNFLRNLPDTEKFDFYEDVHQAAHNDFIETFDPDTLYATYFTAYNDEAYIITFVSLFAVINSTSSEYDHDYYKNEISKAAYEALDHIRIGDSRN